MIKLERIIIDVNGQEIRLTIKEARELKEALDELFEKEVEIQKEYVPYYPYPYNPYPHYYPTYTTYTIDSSQIKITPMWENGLRTTSGGCAQSLGGIPWTDGSWSTSLCNDIVNRTYT